MSLDSDDRGEGGKSGGDAARPEGSGPVELTTLATVYDPMEAQIIVAKLQSAGIQAYLRHDAVSNVIGVAFDGVGRQEIIVREEDLSEARAALEQESE